MSRNDWESYGRSMNPIVYRLVDKYITMQDNSPRFSYYICALCNRPLEPDYESCWVHLCDRHEDILVLEAIACES